MAMGARRHGDKNVADYFIMIREAIHSATIDNIIR